MNRRSLLTSLGIGITTAVAGCMDNSGPEPTGERSEQRSVKDMSDEEIQEMLDEQVEEAYENRVENGELVHGHNVNLISINEISDDSVTLETTMSINPENDYTIKIHYNPVTVNENGEWVYENYTDRIYGVYEPEYDETNHEWSIDYDNAKRVQYDFSDASPGEVVSSITVPSEAFWDHDFDLGVTRQEKNEYENEYEMPRRDNIHGYGWSYINEYELETTPNMHETFVLTATWHDENTRSPRSGEIVASTPPMLRVDEDTYLYPRTHDGGSVVHPTWEDDLWQANDEDRQYSSDDVYRNEFDNRSSVKKSYITRLSNYGRFSPRIRNEYSDRNSVSVASVHGPEYFDSNMQFPWTISYEITHDERFEADSAAGRAITSDSSQAPAVRDLLNSPEVMNHDVIQDIASQLGDVCEMMNATHPSEQVRVVADFVQYFSHTQEGTSPFAEPQSLHLGTAHPVVTLYRGLGDCKDYTVLGNAILQQEPFNMNPDAIVLPGIETYVAEDDTQGEVGHITTALPMSELGLDEFDVVESVGEPVVGDFETVQIDGVEHAYVEMSGPFEVGYISTQWLSRTNPVSMGRYLDNL